MTPAQAVRGLLEALAGPHGCSPPGFEAQVGLYRSLLSDRRLLVLLDNARDAEQVRALLPGFPTCRAVFTSRVEPAGLVAADGAYPVPLDVLSDLDARQMLTYRLGQEPGERRTGPARGSGCGAAWAPVAEARVPTDTMAPVSINIASLRPLLIP